MLMQKANFKSMLPIIASETKQSWGKRVEELGIILSNAKNNR